jgi:asparagine synthase (glutamine-hydrolysing)
VEALRDRLRRSRARARRFRHKLDILQAKNRRQRAELKLLRAWSLEVFPDHPVPADLVHRLDAIRSERLTFLTAAQIESLASCVLEAEAAERPGILVEAGTALGGSAIAMALAKAPERALRVYDVFGMIPPPGEEDGPDVRQRYQTITAGQARGLGPGELYYGYRDDLLTEVAESFARHGVPVEDHAVTLVKGLFEDTITGDEPVALAHIDGDWYESTLTCLERLSPRLVPGGRLVIDDYFHWSGCRQAVDAYFASRPGFRVEMRSKVHVVKLGEST